MTLIFYDVVIMHRSCYWSVDNWKKQLHTLELGWGDRREESLR